MLIAAVALLASCDNDDITISHRSNVKVDPRGVVSPFTEKVHPEDLESFDNTEYNLRVRVFAYDKEGVLRAQGTQYAGNYNTVESFNLDLVPGDYTLVAITDLAGIDSYSVSEYWHLSDSDRIATTKLTDTGYIGGENKILGIGTANLTVSEETQETTIYPKPAGALIYVEFDSIHSHPAVERYTLAESKASQSIQLTTDGNYSISERSNNGEFDWRLTYIEPNEAPDLIGVYGYYFVLPMRNVSFKLQYRISGSDTDRSYSDTQIYMDFEAGKQYGIWINLNDPNKPGGGPTVTPYTLTGSSAKKSSVLTRSVDDTYYLQDILKSTLVK